jgi:hypothetical protein
MYSQLRDGSFRRCSPPSPAALVRERSSTHAHSSQHLPSGRCEAPADLADFSLFINEIK